MYYVQLGIDIGKCSERIWVLKFSCFCMALESHLPSLNASHPWQVTLPIAWTIRHKKIASKRVSYKKNRFLFITVNTKLLRTRARAYAKTGPEMQEGRHIQLS